MINKVLIIKLGYSETLDKEIGTRTSLGDVLRTTVILNYFKDDDITWLVDEKAYPLLENNPFIRRILIFNLESVLQLQREKFDTIVNLEKGPGICAFSDPINAWRRFGFRFLDDTAEVGVKAISFVSHGESTCSPYFYDAVIRGKANGLDMAVGTNGGRASLERPKEEPSPCM